MPDWYLRANRAALNHRVCGTVVGILLLFMVVDTAHVFRPFPEFRGNPLTLIVAFYFVVTLVVVVISPRAFKARADELLLLRWAFACGPFLGAFAALAAGGPQELLGPGFALTAGLIIFSTVAAARARA